MTDSLSQLNAETARHLDRGFRQAIDEVNRNAYSREDVVEAMCVAYFEKRGCGDRVCMNAALDKYLEMTE